MVDYTASRQHVVLDSGGSNQITIYTTNIEEIREKVDLKEQVVPSSTSDPVATNTVDLLKISVRFSFRGFIDSTDKSKLRKILYTKGPVTFVNYDGEIYNNSSIILSKFVMEKFSVTKGVNEEDELPVTITGFLAQNNLA